MIWIDVWFGLVCVLAANALFAVFARRDTGWAGATVAAYVVGGVAAYWLMQIPLGHPDYDPLPHGDFTVLGARIDVDVAIYAMLDDGSGEPHLYRLPYTTGQADRLQKAIDETAGGQAAGVKARSDDQGLPEFYAEPVREDPPKNVERPMVTQ